MISAMTPATREQMPAASERTMPAAPFPHKYIHSVFNDCQNALQAARALRAAGYDAQNIHVLVGSDYVDAVEQGQTLFGSLVSIDLDAYLDQARQGYTIVAVRLSNYRQLEQVRDLLYAHHAHLMKYVDTWTVAQLLP